MNTIELLTGARNYIARGFCKHQRAITANGEPALPQMPHAAAWCAEGAMLAAYIDIDIPPTDPATSPIMERAENLLDWAVPADFMGRSPMNRRYVPYNNDPDTTQDDMLAVFDEAITLAKTEAQRASPDSEQASRVSGSPRSLSA